MNLYEKIKEFTSLKPATIDIGNYLKDAQTVYKIYYDMLAIDNGNSDISEAELDIKMGELLKHWKI